MNERTRPTLRQPLEHLGSPRFMACQPFVLAHQPPDQEQVHVPPHRLERRSVEPAVILPDPARATRRPARDSHRRAARRGRPRAPDRCSAAVRDRSERPGIAGQAGTGRKILMFALTATLDRTPVSGPAPPSNAFTARLSARRWRIRGPVRGPLLCLPMGLRPLLACFTALGELRGFLALPVKRALGLRSATRIAMLIFGHV